MRAPSYPRAHGRSHGPFHAFNPDPGHQAVGGRARAFLAEVLELQMPNAHMWTARNGTINARYGRLGRGGRHSLVVMAHFFLAHAKQVEFCPQLCLKGEVYHHVQMYPPTQRKNIDNVRHGHASHVHDAPHKRFLDCPGGHSARGIAPDPNKVTDTI